MIIVPVPKIGVLRVPGYGTHGRRHRPLKVDLDRLTLPFDRQRLCVRVRMLIFGLRGNEKPPTRQLASRFSLEITQCRHVLRPTFERNLYDRTFSAASN